MKTTVFLLSLSSLLLLSVVQVFAQFSPAEEAQRHFDRGSVAVEMAQSRVDLEGAAREFEQATTLAPEWPDAHYNLGLVREKLDNLDGAMASFRRYLQLVPQAVDAEAVKSQINKLEFRREKLLEKQAMPSQLEGAWTGALSYCGGWFPELSFLDSGNGQVVVVLPVTWNADLSRGEDVKKIKVVLAGESVQFGFRAKSKAPAINYTGYCDVRFDLSLVEKGRLKGTISHGPDAPPIEITLKKK